MFDDPEYFQTIYRKAAHAYVVSHAGATQFCTDAGFAEPSTADDLLERTDRFDCCTQHVQTLPCLEHGCSGKLIDHNLRTLDIDKCIVKKWL
jgi:hypothetical protein